MPTSQCSYLHSYYNHICLYSSNSNVLLTSEGCGFHVLFRASLSHLLWDPIPSLPPSSCALNLSLLADSFIFSMWTSISTCPFQQPSILLLLFCWLCYLCLHPPTETSLAVASDCLTVKSKGMFSISPLYSLLVFHDASLPFFLGLVHKIFLCPFCHCSRSRGFCF